MKLSTLRGQTGTVRRVALHMSATFAAMACMAMGSSAHAACSGAGIPGYYSDNTAIASGAVLCEATKPFGRADFAYTVKYQNSNFPFNVITYNKTLNGELKLRAMRRVKGAAGDATDLFKGQDTARPVILWMHGGGFTAGTRNDLESYAKAFAQRGFVSVLPDYALVPQQDFATKIYGIAANAGTTLTVTNVSQEAQRNIQTAVRYLRASAGSLNINASKIYVVGVSAGAISGIRAATRPADIGTPLSLSLRDTQPTLPPGTPAGTPLPQYAPLQSNQSSHIAGTVAISGLECFPGAPSTITISGITLNIGTCTVQSNAANSAKFRILHGVSDGALPYTFATNTCTAYGTQCIGITPYYPYPTNEIGSGTSHVDGSVGACNYQGPAVWGGGLAPGGDHFFADPYWCQSRAGITSQGELAPGVYANSTNDKATVAVQIDKALTNYGAYLP
jgi:hypothetical protein